MATIISHRGCWSSPQQRNSEAALRRSYELGFGAETDVRDHAGTLVIAHDPPRGGEIKLSAVLAAYRASAVSGPLALNVKADGLQQLLADALDSAQVPYFVFDMSVPDMVAYARASMRYFTRQSEYELVPVLYEDAAGVWVDCFERAWVDEACVAAHLSAGKDVCLVSPELHGRDPAPAWEAWSSWPVLRDPRVIVCTDLPERAAETLR